MATSGYSDESNNAAGLTKWPLEYVQETEEFTCGWCGHVFTLNLTHREIKSFKDLLKVNQKIEGLNADVRTRVDQMKAELMEEIKTELLNIKIELRTEISFDRTEFNNKILDLKSDIKKDLASRSSSDVAVTTLLNKFNILEEKVREMGVDQEKKMEKVNEPMSGVAQTISTVVHSMLDGGTSTDTDEGAKMETEAVRVKLEKNDGEIQSTKTGLEDEVARLKTGAETNNSEQVTTNHKDGRLIKRKMEDETAIHLANYKKKLQFEKNRLVLYQESPYFYTEPNGYRIQVRMMLNGDEGGSGPSVRILFWTGKYDADLPKSFLHSTTVTLINRKEPQRSIEKTIVQDIINTKDFKFEICKFKKMRNLVENNDTLFCKVVIKSPQQLN